MIQELTDFKKQVENSDEFLILDFWAEWCAPCRAMMPALEAVSKKLNVTVHKVNIDNPDNQSLAVDHHVRAVPTLIMFKDGKVIDRKSGMQTEQQLEEWIEGKTV